MSRTDKTSFIDYKFLHLFGVEMIFTDIKNYQNLIETFLHDEKKKFEDGFSNESIEEESKKAGEHHNEYYEHLLNSYIDRHRELADVFPNNFRAFLLTQVISVIESELKKICNHYGVNNNQKFDVDDLAGSNDLEKCKTYLKTISNVDFGKFNTEWLFIKKCKIIRNKIVHSDSKVKLTDEIMSFIKSNSSISYEEPKYLPEDTIQFQIINKDLADELIKKGQDFFIKLLEELKYSS